MRGSSNAEQGAHVLLTGATGFLGKVVLEQALRKHPNLGMTLIMRPRGKRGAEARFRRLSSSPCFARLPRDWIRQVNVVEGDLSQPGAGLTAEDHNALARRVTHVVNCAASVDFDLPMNEALRANVDSALNLMELARACPGLQSVVNVSTAYVSPHRVGTPIEEELSPLTEPASELYDRIRRGAIESEQRLLAENARPNTYTLTKALCEHLLLERYHDLPLTILRPSIISAARAEPFPGWIDSGAAFAAFVYLVGAGHLQELIGHPHARLDIVPCDVVGTHILGELFQAPNPLERARIRHSTAGLDQSASIGEAAVEITQFFRHYPVDRPSRIRYLGPNPYALSFSRVLSNAFGLLAMRGSMFRRRAREKRRQADAVNARFRYFTRSTFIFRSSLPWPGQPLDPREYIRTVCRGVYRHMMRRDERELLVAGRRHRRGQHDWNWLISYPVGGGATRLVLHRLRTRLSRWADRVTVDEPSLIEAREQAAPGSLLIMHPVVSHSTSTAALLTAYTILTRPNVQFGSVWVLSEDRLPEAVSNLLPHGPELPRAHRRPWVIAARDGDRQTPTGTVHDSPVQLTRLLAAGARLSRVTVDLATVPDEHSLTQQEDASTFLIGRTTGGLGGTRLLRQIARSLPPHHCHVRSAHLRFRLAESAVTPGSATELQSFRVQPTPRP